MSKQDVIDAGPTFDRISKAVTRFVNSDAGKPMMWAGNAILQGAKYKRNKLSRLQPIGGRPDWHTTAQQNLADEIMGVADHTEKLADFFESYAKEHEAFVNLVNAASTYRLEFGHLTGTGGSLGIGRRQPYPEEEDFRLAIEAAKTVLAEA